MSARQRSETLMISALFRAGWLAVLCLVYGAQAAEPTVPDPAVNARFRVSQTGDEVTDVQAKLVWRRCVEGMAWNGSVCTGKPQLFDHGQAQAAAKTVFLATKLPWRLPHIPELKRLMGVRTPHIPDPLLFPQAPLGWHWSGSTTIAGAGTFNPYNYGNIAQGRVPSSMNQVAFLHGWALNFETGESRGDVLKRTPMVVRLVRGAN